MAKRPASLLEECLPKRMIPPDDPGRVTVTSLACASAGRETLADKLQFDVVSTDQARLLVVGCVLIDHAAVRFERLVQPCFSHRSPIRDRGRRDACVTTWQTKICLRHRITCLSRYFAQSVCMGLYGVRYSLYIIYS